MNLSSSSMVIGTDIRELHIVNGAGGSGTDVNTGWVGGITFGAASNAASGGIYAQSSGSYGTRLYFATTDSFAQGAKARMMIQSNGRVGINTLTPSNYLSVVGNIDAKMFISNQHSSGTTTKSLEIISTISGKPIDYWWGIGSGNTNHGLYDENSTNTGDEKWILLADTTNNTWRYNGQIQLKAHTSDTTAAKTYNFSMQRPALLQVLNNLSNAVSGQSPKCVLGTLRHQLTTADVAIATGKGYTVS